MIEIADLQRALDSTPADSDHAIVLQEMIAARRIADAALKRHEAWFSFDEPAYVEANDLLTEQCEMFLRMQAV